MQLDLSKDPNRPFLLVVLLIVYTFTATISNPAIQMSISAHRGEILHFLDDPGQSGDAAAGDAWNYISDGLLILEVESDRDSPEGGPGWELRDRRVYGGSAILFYAWSKPA